MVGAVCNVLQPAAHHQPATGLGYYPSHSGAYQQPPPQGQQYYTTNPQSYQPPPAAQFMGHNQGTLLLDWLLIYNSSFILLTYIACSMT